MLVGAEFILTVYMERERLLLYACLSSLWQNNEGHVHVAFRLRTF